MKVRLKNKEVEITPDKDVNIFVGRSDHNKREIMRVFYLDYLNKGIRASYLSLFYLVGRINGIDNLTEDIENLILNECKENDAVFINGICDLMFIENQQSIIRKCIEANPNVCLFITTNSPSMLYEGWQNRPINVDDIDNEANEA